MYRSGGDRGDLRFAGQKGYQDDDGTGMQWLGSRYYVPYLGRFLTPDPIGQEGGLNLYAYCENSPLNKVDPKGTYEVWLGWHEIALGASHSFVMVRDNDQSSKTYGWTWAYSGAPQRFNLDSFTNPGLLMDRSGLYTPWHFDSRVGNPQFEYHQVQLESNNMSVGPLLNALRRDRSQFMSLGLEYNLLEGPNSNTFASMTLERIGIYEGSGALRRRGDWTIGQLSRKGLEFPGWGWPRR